MFSGQDILEKRLARFCQPRRHRISFSIPALTGFVKNLHAPWSAAKRENGIFTVSTEATKALPPNLPWVAFSLSEHKAKLNAHDRDFHGLVGSPPFIFPPFALIA